MERRLRGEETARGLAQADALATRRDEGARAERAERAEQRSRALARSLHGAARGEADAVEGLGRLRASEAEAQRFLSTERKSWERRAHAAEAHNERVAGLLSKYVVRNSLRVPTMPAAVLGAQQVAELHAVASTAR